MSIKDRIIRLERNKPPPRSDGTQERENIARKLERIRYNLLDSVEHDPKSSIAENMVRRMVREGTFEGDVEALRSGASWPPEMLEAGIRARAARLGFKSAEEYIDSFRRANP